MWLTKCGACGWTSGEKTEDEAKVLGIFHEQDTPGHAVVLIETTLITGLSPVKLVA